jgi:tetratricopeptide (TPR) repeat protein
MGDARLEQARALASAGQFRDAMGILKGIMQANPQDAEARQLLSEVQDQMMLELQIGDMLSKAEALVAQGQSEQARKTLADVLKVSPNHPKAKAMAQALEAAPSAPPEPFSPEATLAMDAFDIEPLPGSSPAMTLDSLDAIDSQGFSPAVESTSFSSSSGTLGPAESARVKQYVKEGQDLFAQGRYQDAIDVWTRIFIVDETNKEADNLIAKAKEALNANQGEIEHNLTEGIAAFNAGDVARAKPLLERVIQSFPGHREALYYLSRISELTAAPPPPPPSISTASLPPLQQGPQQPAPFSAPPPIFSAGQAERPAPPPSGPTLSAGSPDEFELEDNLDLPTGEALRSPTPGSSFGGFEFDSSADTSGFGAPGAPPAAPVPVPAAGEPATAPEPEEFSWGQTPAASPEATPGFGAPAFGGAAEEPAAPARTVKTPPKTKGGGIPWLLIGAAVGVLVLVGAGILAVFLFMGEGPGPATVSPTKIPKPQPPKVTPPPTVPAETGGSTPATMSPDELLRAARAAESEKDFAKAVALYQELLNRGGNLNTEAASGLAAARSALQRQQAENERNEKFIKDYQYALKGYREGDYSECLRVAWRLIYPDDTLARQLGKRDAVSRLIKDGYYNWAVMDLKGENVRGADKNIRDLLDFDKNDPEARKLAQFIRPYLTGNVDQNYRDVAKSLTYRPPPESP